MPSQRSRDFSASGSQVLPHPYPAADRKAGFRYRLSVLQAEFSLTQIWDCPRHGREFFEEVIRENIDLGRPETVQLIFARKMRRSTVITGHPESLTGGSGLLAGARSGPRRGAGLSRGSRGGGIYRSAGGEGGAIFAGVSWFDTKQAKALLQIMHLIAKLKGGGSKITKEPAPPRPPIVKPVAPIGGTPPEPPAPPPGFYIPSIFLPVIVNPSEIMRSIECNELWGTGQDCMRGLT